MKDPRAPGTAASRRDRRHSRRVLMRGAAALGLAAASAPGVAQSVGGQPATPAVATPAAPGARSITRDEYLAAVRQHFALESPPTRGGHVISAQYDDPGSLNPIAASDAYSVAVVENLFSTLVRQSVIDGSWVPDLADFWEVSADGRVYTFHLNQNATWHDGRPVTAHDCAFTLDSVLDEDSLSNFRSSFIRVITRYRAIDDHTFELVGKEPIATLLDNSVGGLYIVPQHIWEGIPLTEWGAAPGATGTDPAQVVGSGPFRFGEWGREGHVSIVRNDDYWVPEMVPVIDEVTWRALPEASATLQALVVGEIDFCDVPPGQADALRNSNPKLVLTINDENSWLNYALNGDPARVPFFVDPRVRQAMLYALDRDALIDSLLDGYGTRADGIYPPSASAHAPERLRTIYDFDPGRARSLLDEAGWVEVGNGTRAKDGLAFEMELHYAGKVELIRQIATYLQQAWREIGISVEATAIGFPILQQRQDAGEYQAAINAWAWFGDDQGALYRCDAIPPNGFNRQRICSPEFDRLNDASLFELDPARRRELLIEQGNVVNDAATLGLLFFRKGIVAAQPHLRNFFTSPHAVAGCLPWVWLADED